MPRLKFHKKFSDKFRKLNEKERERIYKRLLLRKISFYSPRHKETQRIQKYIQVEDWKIQN
jgi:hypothetical protein